MAKSCNRRLWAVVLFAVLSSAAGSAAAQETPTEAEAERHHQRGVELFRENHFADAAVEFQRAQTLSPTRTNIWNLARCYQQLERYDAALAQLEMYLSDAELPADRRPRAVALRDEIRARLAESRATATEPAVQTPEPVAPPQRSLAGPWALLGAGLVVALAGGVLDIVAFVDSRRDPSENFVTIAEYNQWENGFENLALAGDILLGVGVAAAIAGLTWLLVWRRQNRQGREASTRPRVMALAGADGGSLLLSGWF